jgi:septum formation protein
LASASPRRREILRQLGVRFLVDPSSAAERKRKSRESPAAYALRLALLKAREVRKQHRTGIVIGADTVVAVENLILGKPRSRQEARAMLRRLQGRWHRVITAVCLADVESGRVRSGCSYTRVHFRRLANAEIEWYLKTGEYRDKAGAYAIQGYGSLLIDRLEGCYFNVVGFPVVTFMTLCRKMGIRLIP